MKLYTFLLSIILGCYGCISPRETIINAQNGEKIVGYRKQCLYQIGAIRKDEIPQEKIDALIKDSLHLVFNYISFGQAHDKLLGVWVGGKYITSKGIKPGDTVQKALNIYGVPKASRLEYWRDEKHKIKWEFHGLFYENLALITDSTFSTILGVSVGNHFETDKKYIKENRFKNAKQR